MKIVAFVGSPRKNGNSAFLTRRLMDLLEKKGHDGTIHFLYDKKIKGCIACDACTNLQTEICIHNDDFNVLAAEIIKADVMVFASPIYMGQITGPMKTFIDRWYTFADEKFAIRHVQNKKFITITTSGAPPEQFAGVTEYLKYWLGEFFKMQPAGTIIGGNLFDPSDAEKNPQLLQEIDRVVAGLK
jgi:multimeric flavodoxin WrbA